MDVEDIASEYIMELETHYEEMVESMNKIQGGRTNPRMFDDVEVQAYNDIFPLSELAQVMVRGENNLLVQLYDQSLTEATIKAISTQDQIPVSCNAEGKMISIKITSSKKELLERVKKEANQILIKFKGETTKTRNEAVKEFKTIELIADKDEIEIHSKEVNELVNDLKKKAENTLNEKLNELAQADKL